MAIWPWARGWENQQQDIARFPHMKAWLDRIAARPAVAEGQAVAADVRGDLTSDREAQKILFGRTALR